MAEAHREKLVRGESEPPQVPTPESSVADLLSSCRTVEFGPESKTGIACFGNHGAESKLPSSNVLIGKRSGLPVRCWKCQGNHYESDCPTPPPGLVWQQTLNGGKGGWGRPVSAPGAQPPLAAPPSARSTGTAEAAARSGLPVSCFNSLGNHHESANLLDGGVAPS